MSSWIPSLFNPFTDDDNPTSPEPSSPTRSPSSGAKDDLSAVFRGVAAFLAPPPAASSTGPSSSSETIEGIKSDLAEIQGTFRTGLSLISSKITSNLLQLQNQLNDGDGNDNLEEEEEEEEDDDDEEGLGISDEVLDFVLKISRRPELWADFPLSLPDDFHLSDHQREHAANIDHLVPEFQTLRQKICSQMSNGKFWLIYFILLLPRLNEDDLKLLSTPQLFMAREISLRKELIILHRSRAFYLEICLNLLITHPQQVAEARETLLKKLQNKTDQETSENPESSDAKDALAESVNPTQQKEIVDETESGHRSEEFDAHPSIDTQNEEDVSFSDLEDEDDDPSADKVSAGRASTSDKAWVQLDEPSGSRDATQKADHNASKDKESEGEDSNDWLTVDDTDFDNLGAV